MAMEYRRLGPTGLKVSVLSFGSWVTFGTQVDTGLARDCLSAAREAGVNFFDNAESYAGGESERIMGEAIAELNWPRWSYVISTKLYWGIHEAPNMQLTLNRKYLHAGHRRFARAPRTRLRGPAVLPPGRPRDAHRGDGVGHVRHRVVGQGALLGHLGVERGRHPRRVGHRRAPPPAQAGHGAAAVQPVRAPEGRAGVRPALRRHRPGPHHLEPAGLGPADREVRRRHPRRQPRRAARLRVAGRRPDRRGPQRQGQAAGRHRRAPRLPRWPSWPSPGARPTPTCRPSSPAPAGWSRSTRTWPPSTCWPGSPPRCWPRSRRSCADGARHRPRLRPGPPLGGAGHPQVRRAAPAVQHRLRGRRRRA